MSSNFKLKRILISLFIIFCLLIITIICSCTLITQSSVKPQYTDVPTVSTALLTQHVKQLSINYFPRDYTHLNHLNLAADYIKMQLITHSERVSEQSFSIAGKTYRNIIAQFGPEQGERIVIGAHYDACGSTRGADDNASGVAGLLELARLLKASPPLQPVELVAYTLEEPPFFNTGHMGSSYHARWLAENKHTVKLMISMEMIGYFSDKTNSQHFPLGFMKYLYSDKGNFISVVSNMENRKVTAKVKSLMMGASDLPVYSLNAPSSVPGVDFSDHQHYWKNNFPAVMVTDTSFYRNHSYHEPYGDTWDSLDYDRMAKVVQGIYAVTHHF